MLKALGIAMKVQLFIEAECDLVMGVALLDRAWGKASQRSGGHGSLRRDWVGLFFFMPVGLEKSANFCI